jgi:PAS domain S-box-containing protein
MSEPREEPKRAAQLRSRADEIAREKGAPSPHTAKPLSPEEAQQIIHELQVHQIELSLQNEELLRTQAEMDALRARYFDLYNLAPVGYLVISVEGLIMEVNLTASTLLGLPRAALVKKPIHRFIFEEDQDVYYMHRKKLHVSGETHSCELRMARPDGTTFWALLTASAAQDPSSVPKSYAERAAVSRVVLSDISERKRLEEERAELVAQLRQAREQPPAGHETGPTAKGGKPVGGNMSGPR